MRCGRQKLIKLRSIYRSLATLCCVGGLVARWPAVKRPLICTWLEYIYIYDNDNVIHEKDTLQIMVANKQQSPNLGMPVESCKKLIWLIINRKAIIYMTIYSIHVYMY